MTAAVIRMVLGGVAMRHPAAANSAAMAQKKAPVAAMGQDGGFRVV